jgi:hypothetical protein
MMNRARVFHCGDDPCLDDFKDKKAILGHHPCVGYPTLEICKALLDERCTDSRSSFGREAKRLELVYVRTRRITATHDLFSYLHCWNVNDTFVGCLQQAERIVAMFGRPSRRAVVTMTTGPGSSKP